MLRTAAGQMRFGASIGLGASFSARSLERLVASVAESMEEFGALGPGGDEFLGGPTLDPQTRREVQTRRFRTQAVHAAGHTAYYARLFRNLGVEPKKLSFEDIRDLPTTPKEALRSDPEAFVSARRAAQLRAATTGTTGVPTSVYFSKLELTLIGALAAMHHLPRRIIGAEDIVQVSINPRAVAGIRALTEATEAIGATIHISGLLSPENALALLAERHRLPGKKARVSVLRTYPSYLGQLTQSGLQLGYRPTDFGLERVLAGGEILSEGLRRRCQELFGPVDLYQNYSMTELAPFGGNRCSDGHFHFDPAAGLLEVASLETGRPATMEEPGVIVATPLPPFRETTILLRYDTEDIVRRLEGPLQCEMAGTPATTNLLGKRRFSVRHDYGWTFPRDVVEAIEAVDAMPLPARWGMWRVRQGVAVEVVGPEDDGRARRCLTDEFERRGVPVRELTIVGNPSELRRPVPLRGDLREGRFLRGGLKAPVEATVVSSDGRR